MNLCQGPARLFPLLPRQAHVEVAGALAAAISACIASAGPQGAIFVYFHTPLGPAGSHVHLKAIHYARSIVLPLV